MSVIIFRIEKLAPRRVIVKVLDPKLVKQDSDLLLVEEQDDFITEFLIDNQAVYNCLLDFRTNFFKGKIEYGTIRTIFCTEPTLKELMKLQKYQL